MESSHLGSHKGNPFRYLALITPYGNTPLTLRAGKKKGSE
jgi:hypothetical protein